MLADGDVEANLRLAADGDDGMGVEAAVGQHGEFSGGSGVTHATHRLPQEIGGASGLVLDALVQPSHQHVAGASSDGQQRVIASHASVPSSGQHLSAHLI